MRMILFRKVILITKYSKKKICTTKDSKIQRFEDLKKRKPRQKNDGVVVFIL